MNNWQGWVGAGVQSWQTQGDKAGGSNDCCLLKSSFDAEQNYGVKQSTLSISIF